MEFSQGEVEVVSDHLTQMSEPRVGAPAGTRTSMTVFFIKSS